MSETTREVFDTLAKVLLRCWIFGFVLQLVTVAAVLLMGETLHNMHGAMFGLSNHDSDMITVGYLSLLKLCVAVFFFIPWLSIWLVLKKTDSNTSQN